ncbi:MAG: BlaI/MecI/CopY family transcriptional regulator [Bacteroidota bacterium]|nr:BlaI/MecI/CopY family transcriptional regulator [Bacteroidota bacterium]
METKELTKAEEQVMQILWEIEKGFVNDIINKMQEPKPAYTTVSTIVRILEKKGFIGHKSFGNTHEYFPRISKDTYSKNYLKGFMKGYFSNSIYNMVSFLSKNEQMDINEMEEIISLLDEKIKTKKSGV